MSYEWLVFIILLMLSAFFSGFESAILSLRLSRIRELVKKRVHNAKLVEKLKEDQHATLITLLIGNNIVNISASALATKMAFDFASHYSIEAGYIIAIATGVMTFILLVFGEITPKTFAVRKAEKFALKSARFFNFFRIIFKPFAVVFEGIASLILRFFGASKQESGFYTTGELREFVEMSHEKGTLRESEKEMIHNILNFNDILVREIMKPLGDVVAVEASMTLAEFSETVGKDNFSRIPVYEKHIEDIVGVVYLKDILPYLKRGETQVRMREIMRRIAHVPAVKKIGTLFHYFKNKKEHIAVVVNEFGNTLGIVTMEDVLEELVGEIQDEYDDESENNIKVVDKYTIIAPGSINIDDVNEMLAIKIDDKEGTYQTIAGYIFYQSGKIPKTGTVLNIGPVTITIIDATHKKINKVKIEKNMTSNISQFKKDLVESASARHARKE